MAGRYVRLVALALFLSVAKALAQQYPVQVTTLLTPPYSLFLSDYSSPDRAALQLILHLKELDRAEYKVRLHLQIEGQGISLYTKSNYLPPPLVLQGGIPEMLTGDQIRGYLHPDNLEFTGITRQQFLKTGKFPEGFYTFSVQVLDYFREEVVSNNGQANAWIILKDQPLINLPFNNEKLIATEPQNILFSGTPRHTASPNAAFSTEYLFQLLELYPADRNPNDAFLSANTIYETTTISPLRVTRE
jgi:hypothetical protein